MSDPKADRGPKSRQDGFYKVDHDYVLATGQLAKAAGVKHFHLVSSQGANKDAWVLLMKTKFRTEIFEIQNNTRSLLIDKGQVEEDLKALDFDRLSIYRPGLLLCDRQERRTGEKIMRVLFKPIAAAFPTAGSIPTSTLAKALLNCAVSQPSSDKKWEIFENKDIHQIAGKPEK